MYLAPSEYAEAEFIAREISDLSRKGEKYEDMAVLYRTHTQARVLEEKLRMYGIPYRVFGGMSFYARKEIKDMVAYLTLLDNPLADTAFLRIVNTPKRGLGNVAVAKLTEFAVAEGISLMEAAQRAGEFLRGGEAKFAALNSAFASIAQAAEGKSVGDMVEAVFERSGYHAMLEAEDTAAQAKIENVQELISSARSYEAQAEEPSLEEFLASLSLISDMDTVEEEGSVTLMTLHGSKGLEFETVFMAGMEENLFPSRQFRRGRQAGRGAPPVLCRHDASQADAVPHGQRGAHHVFRRDELQHAVALLARYPAGGARQPFAGQAGGKTSCRAAT